MLPDLRGAQEELEQFALIMGSEKEEKQEGERGEHTPECPAEKCL